MNVFIFYAVSSQFYLYKCVFLMAAITFGLIFWVICIWFLAFYQSQWICILL